MSLLPVFTQNYSNPAKGWPELTRFCRPTPETAIEGNTPDRLGYFLCGAIVDGVTAYDVSSVLATLGAFRLKAQELSH